MKGAVTAAALLIGTVFAFAPAVQAEPGYECAEQDVGDKVVHTDYLRVSVRRDCSFDIALFEGIICVGGWGGTIEQDVDKHTVSASYCDGGIGDRIEIRGAAAAGCPTYSGSSWLVSFQTGPDCTADVGVIDSYRVCDGTGLGWDYAVVSAGGSTAYIGYCTPEDFITIDKEPVDWCEVRDETPTGPFADIQEAVWGRYDEGAGGECDIDVDPIGGCIGGGGKVIERRADPVHVRLLICGPYGLPPVS